MNFPFSEGERSLWLTIFVEAYYQSILSETPSADTAENRRYLIQGLGRILLPYVVAGYPTRKLGAYLLEALSESAAAGSARVRD